MDFTLFTHMLTNIANLFHQQCVICNTIISVEHRLLIVTMGYPWNDYVSNQQLLYEIELRSITSIVRQCQLRLYGHVARYPKPILLIWLS